ncbi:Cys-Gly metallodipeptidase DUG1 [Seminavis robusta]|uniref:Cys-Gly metallodipeptidase DUG1 n=1 Tax=Seminavis robusta TaxID=568900 RepID=A0A9N8DF33_9STRA|nr:Cys-Gly metallodipeptidase DUG1 [Seminavis robusta]|eukprot:Sro87_g046140.1 Cys-Gly metallodipeptidase DUG1 (513) ;mRNA; r:82687-84677
MSDDFSEKFFQYVDERKGLYIERLAEAVGIPSVSSELDTHLPDIVKMMTWTKEHADRLGAKTTLLPNPAATPERPLPPILLGEFHVDPAKKTVCVYGHLDVQPAKKEDGWDTDPFVLTEKDGKLYGRGSTDDKGPALSWLWVVEAHRELGVELPVNLKILYEGMEEFGSDGLFECIKEEAKEGKFLDDVDFFCISDNYWLGKTKPCLTYGLRGIAYFELQVQGCEQDLHSGVLGGTVHEAMTDVIKLMGTLVDSNGKILVKGVMDDVAPVTPEEEALYDNIEFDMEAYKEESKVSSVSNKLLHPDKKSLLMHRWRYPTLSLHGIEGAFSGPGAKTVIPSRVIGKFSLRLVPDQKAAQIESVVKEHVEAEFAKLGSPNKMSIKMSHGAKAWLSSPNHPNFQAASKATERVHGMPPDLTREGGSIPITSAIEDATGMNVLLLPIGACDDMAHSQNEKYNIPNLTNGIKVLGVYLHEVAKIEGPKPSTCKCVPLTEEELMVPGAFMKGFRCKCEI